MSVYYKYLLEDYDKPIPLFNYKGVKVMYRPIHVSDRYNLRVENNFKPETIRPYIKQAIDNFNVIPAEKLKKFIDCGSLSITIVSKSYPYKLAGTLYTKNDNDVTLFIRTILSNTQKSKDDNENGWILYTESKQNSIIIYVD